LDATLATPRHAVRSVVFLRSRIRAEHPSAPILGEERMGAACAVEEQRLLTAHYLVLGADSVEVEALDGRSRQVSRIGLDHETGLAVLDLEGPPLPPLPLQRGLPIGPGLPVFLLTCADGSQRKGASGHVTHVGPFEAFWEYMLDAAIMTTVVNPGLAGAPLLDIEGRLLGVVSLGLAAPGRYSLAIPSELYLERRAVLTGDQDRERPGRAWIGFYPHASFDGGVAITGVVPGGPAEQAGLAAGDMLLSIEGVPVANLRELYGEIWKHHPGERIGFQTLRESAIRVTDVVAGDRYEFFR
jgi:serine protease DegS